MKTIYETRQLLEPVELRESVETGGRVAFGYAARFNKRSQDLGGFYEEVGETAFAKTLAESDVRGLFNHDPNLILGRTKSGTLRIGTDQRGLFYEIDLPDTTTGRDLAESMRRGDVTGSSFAFRTITDTWSETDDGTPLRTLTDVQLRDVSPVTYPAYADAESAIRSLAEARSLDADRLVDAYRNDSLAMALAAGEQTDDENTDVTGPPRKTHAPPSFRHLVVS